MKDRPFHDQTVDSLSRTATVQRTNLPISGVSQHLGRQILDAAVPERQDFTGQVVVEVHCKDGVIRGVYLAPRWQM